MYLYSIGGCGGVPGPPGPGGVPDVPGEYRTPGACAIPTSDWTADTGTVTTVPSARVIVTMSASLKIPSWFSSNGDSVRRDPVIASISISQLVPPPLQGFASGISVVKI